MAPWTVKINVKKAAAKRQIEIANSFPCEKQMKIALDFANLGVQQTLIWIKNYNPIFF